MKSSDTLWNEFATVVDQTNSPDINLIKASAQKLVDAVAYECQKHILTKLLDHARGHRVGTTATGAVDEAWAHEIDYIERNMAVLEQMFNPAKIDPQVASYVDFLKELFPHMQIVSMEELFGSADPQPVAGHDFAEDAKDYAEDGAQGRQEGFTPVSNLKYINEFKATHVHHKTNGMYMHIVDASDEETGNVRSIYCNEWGHTFDRPAKDFHDGTRFGKIS